MKLQSLKLEEGTEAREEKDAVRHLRGPFQKALRDIFPEDDGGRTWIGVSTLANVHRA